MEASRPWRSMANSTVRSAIASLPGNLKTDPGAERSGEHAQALGGLLHEFENMSLERIWAESNVPLSWVGPRIPL